MLDAAQRDPDVLVGGPGPVTLDEVQRAPELLRAVKRAIDRDRKSGRFLLTGSANLDAASLGIAGWSGELSHALADDSARTARTRAVWPLG